MDDFEPGHPVDERLPQRAERESHSVDGDFERMAARVLARLTGERVVLQDDGSEDGMADIRVEHSDRDPDYVEVWTDVDEKYAALSQRLYGKERTLPLEISVSGSHVWFVTLARATNVNRLSGDLPSCLLDLESRGVTFERVADRRQLTEHDDASVARLVAFGVVGLSSRPATGEEQGKVLLYPEGISGPSLPDWLPVVEWTSQTLASPRLADVRSKLLRTHAAARHAFIGVTFSSPGEVYFALDIRRERSLPTMPPQLPPEISHVWLMSLKGSETQVSALWTSNSVSSRHALFDPLLSSQVGPANRTR